MGVLGGRIPMVREVYLDKAPRLSIKIDILILPSDTPFGDVLYCICFDHTNRETAMLSRLIFLSAKTFSGTAAEMF